MAILNTQINTRSPEFAANRDAMLEQVESLRTLLGKVSEGGDEKSQQRHVARGKLLVRDRINALLDPGSAFLEVAGSGEHCLQARRSNAQRRRVRW